MYLVRDRLSIPGGLGICNNDTHLMFVTWMTLPMPRDILFMTLTENAEVLYISSGNGHFYMTLSIYVYYHFMTLRWFPQILPSATASQL